MLTQADRELLDFESRWYRFPGAKEEAIRAELGISPVRYWQRLRALAEQPEAEFYAPAVVRRIKRPRAA